MLIAQRTRPTAGERDPSTLVGHDHMVMARREVLVQLDDELVEELDRIAAARHTNRSALLRAGAIAVIQAEELAAADRELVVAYLADPPEADLLTTATRLAGANAPSW